MSYEIDGFDPTSPNTNPNVPFSVWKGNFSHNNFYIVHPEEIYRRLEANQEVELAHLELEGYGNIKKVAANACGRTNYDGQPANLFDARITLRREQDWTDSFVEHVDKENFPGIKSLRFLWSNTRVLQSPAAAIAMQANVYSDSILLTNQRTSLNSDHPTRETRLKAPARAEIKPNEQLSHTLNCLGAMLCVAHSMNLNSVVSPRLEFIMTPDGPLYKNPDTGEYVHRLGREKIEVARTKQPEKKSFDQFFGIEDIVDQLQPVVLFYKRPDLAAKWRVKRPGNVLLNGPAGTGKTELIHALAGELDADMYELSPASLYNKWLGDSEKAIQAVFDKVRHAKKPTILLMDEIDSIIGIVEDTTGGARAANAVAGIFKTESAKISEQNPNVILAATTNDTSRLDPALIRAGRFDVQITTNLPDTKSRSQIFGNLIVNYHDFDITDIEVDVKDGANPAGFNPYSPELLNTESLDELARQTDHDFSAADIVEVLRRAALAKATEEERTGEQPQPIDLAFLTKIITAMRRNRN